MQPHTTHTAAPLPGRFSRLALRPLALACLLGLLGGCGYFGKTSPQQTPAPAPAASNSLEAFIASGAPGAQGEALDPVLGKVQVLVGETYVSALGETCRRAVVSGGNRRLQAEPVTLCQGSDKTWRQIPRILTPARLPQGQK